MGREDIAAGKAKQVKGKVNDVAGAVKGDTAQQIKGKIQKGVGKFRRVWGKQAANFSESNRFHSARPLAHLVSGALLFLETGSYFV